MAGASGGRKAICPGIIGEASTHVFHGFRFMADPNSRDLNLKENLVHEEAVEVASAVGIDFLVNVTLDADYRITGIFSGNFIRAHLKAVEFIAKCVKVPAKVADVVVTHGGFVGINHYQLAKCAVASLGILKKNGYLVIVADTNDPSHPVGGVNYITTVALLTRIGAEAFTKLIAGENWQFIPEQWQVQMWCKVFERIPMDHLIFYSPSMDRCWYPAVTWSGWQSIRSRRNAGHGIHEDLRYQCVGTYCHIGRNALGEVGHHLDRGWSLCGAASGRRGLCRIVLEIKVLYLESYYWFH